MAKKQSQKQQLAEKVSKKVANYRMADAGSPARCGNCVMFRSPNMCTKVEGPILKGAWCKFFYSKSKQ